MKYNEKEIRKVCSLYVNDWHLTTMILPHLKEQMIQNKKIITILENGIKSNVEEILSKMNLNKELNNKILEINWTSNNTCKYEKIKDQIPKDIEKLEIIIAGTNEYIENANKTIEKIAKETKVKEITIINCYEISKYKNVKDIIDNYEYILNTSGIKKKMEILKQSKEDRKNAI